MNPAPPTTPVFNDKAGNAWVRLQERTDAYLDPLGRAAMARLDVEPGASVVDVGCGCGQTVLQLAELVGPAGRVLGVDVSGPMLAQAGERAASSTNVTLVRADAQIYPFGPATFDAVYSRFGLMFFDDPVAAFANLRRALRPRGQIAFVCWQALDHNPWAAVPLQAMMDRWPDAPTPALIAPGTPGPFGLADAVHVKSLLSAAGFDDVRVDEFTTSLHLGAATTVDEAVDYCRQLGPSARFLADAPTERKPELERAMRDALEPYTTARGVRLDGAVFLVTARNRG
jgi:SAM-dependent methyltransferase